MDVGQAYRTLGVSSASSQAEIKDKYKKLVSKVHPDVPGGSEQKMKSVNAAYEVLKNHTPHKGDNNPYGSGGGMNGTNNHYHQSEYSNGYQKFDEAAFEAFQKFASQGGFNPEHMYDDERASRPPWAEDPMDNVEFMYMSMDGDFESDMNGFFYKPRPKNRKQHRQNYNNNNHNNNKSNSFKRDNQNNNQSHEGSAQQEEPSSSTSSTSSWSETEIKAFRNMYDNEGRSFSFIAQKLGRPVDDVMKFYNERCEAKYKSNNSHKRHNNFNNNNNHSNKFNRQPRHQQRYNPLHDYYDAGEWVTMDDNDELHHGGFPGGFDDFEEKVYYSPNRNNHHRKRRYPPGARQPPRDWE